MSAGESILMHAMRISAFALLLVISHALPKAAPATSPDTSASRVEAALTNISTLERVGQDGLATIWDGNKYVQCRRRPDQTLRCETAGALMQPSLSRVL